MRIDYKSYSQILKATYNQWVRDRAQNLAASLAFYQLLSVGPFLVVLIILLSKLIGQESVEKDTIIIIKNSMPPIFVDALVLLLKKDDYQSLSDVYNLSLLGAFGVLVGMEYFAVLKDSIETIWNIRTEKTGLLNMIRKKFEDAQITFFAFLIWFVIAYLKSTLPHPLTDDSPDNFLNWQKTLLYVSQYLSTFIFFGVYYFFLFKYIPPIKFHWKLAIPGAIYASVLHIIGREVLMVIISHKDISESMASGILVMLLWFYYVNIITLFTAEISKVYILKKLNMDLSSIKEE